MAATIETYEDRKRRSAAALDRVRDLSDDDRRQVLAYLSGAVPGDVEAALDAIVGER